MLSLKTFKTTKKYFFFVNDILIFKIHKFLLEID